MVLQVKPINIEGRYWFQVLSTQFPCVEKRVLHAALSASLFPLLMASQSSDSSMRGCSAANSEMLGDVILMPLAVCCKSLGEFWGFNWALEWRKGILPCQLKRLFLLPLSGQSPRQS